MALIMCTECKKEISDKAPICPHCGMPQQLGPTHQEHVQVATSTTKFKGIDYKKNGKFIAAATIFILVIIFLIFNPPTPSGMSKSCHESGLKIIEIADDYIDAKITANEAYNKIESLSSRISGSDDYPKDLTVSIYVDSLTWALLEIDSPYSGATIDKVTDARDNLAHQL